MEQEDALKNLAMENETGVKKPTAEPTFHFVTHKAGMQGVDKEKISAVIVEASRDSRYYNKQMKKKDKYETNIKIMKEKIEKAHKDKQLLQGYQTIIDKKVNMLEKSRDLSRTWVHVDMDMFFVACEIRDRPELKDKPVAVGGMGMLSTANYIARQFGVRSAMPGFIAKKLCPELVLIKGDFEKYEETSKRFKKIVAEYDPDYGSGGLDEAVLDLTDYLNEHGINKAEDIEKVCYEMRMRINEVTGITCSCGIAANKMLAKLSTEINKPNGQYYMKPIKEEILHFINRLPVRKIPFIGSSAEQLLNGLGVHTCKDILDNLIDLYISFSEISFDYFVRSALGLGGTHHEAREDRKSINVSRTFQAIGDVPGMENKVKEIAGMLAEDLKYHKKKTKHLTLTTKTHNFDVKNRGTPIPKFTDDEVEIGNVCVKLLRELLPLEPLRLIGIKAADLANGNNLQSLDNIFKKLSSRNTNNNNNNGNNSGNNQAVEAPVEQNVNIFEDQDIDDEEEYSERVHFTDMAIQEVDETSKMSSVSAPEREKQVVHVPALQVVPENTSLSYQRSKGEDIICPVCLMKFESTINNTKINKHLDRCLSAPEPMASTSSNLNVKRVENEGKKEDTKKRKSEDDSNYLRNTLKKTKKTPETATTMKLDSFFTKK